MPQQNKKRPAKMEIIPARRANEIESRPMTGNKTGNVFIGTLNIFVNPAKRRWQRFYHPKNKHWHWHLFVDALLLITVLTLAINLFLMANENPKDNKIELNMATQPGNAPLLQNNLKPNIKPIISNFNITVSSPEKNITPGNNILYEIAYKNNEKFIIKNATVKAHVDNPLSDIKTIIWNKSQVPGLGEIMPGHGGIIKFTIPTKAIEPETASVKNLSSYIDTEASYNLSTPEDGEGFSMSNKFVQKIETIVNLQAAARYYTDEGDQMGTGPLPPVVGKETKYWIILKVDTKYNNANKLLITANLAPNVKWTGKQSTTAENPISYDASTNQIAWKIENVKAPSKFYADFIAAFEIELIPSANQAGQPANLINNISLSGVDEFTGTIIEKNAQNITTNLIFDKLDTSGGVVVN